MVRSEQCARHRTAAASFVCDRCKQPFCPQCRCELLGGGVCCTECAVEAAGENGGEFAAHGDAAYPEVAKARKGKGGRRLLTIVLLVCLPLLGLEGLFLHRSTARSQGPAVEERRVLSETLVLVTVLNRFKAQTGAYPVELAGLVPSHWRQRDSAGLQGFDYRRIGTERFALAPKLTGHPEADAGIVRALALIPRSLGQDSDLDIFLRGREPGGAPE